MRPRIYNWTVALVLFAFLPVAFAADVAEYVPVLDPSAADFDLSAILKLLEGGVQTKNWGVVIVGLLIGSVWIIRFVAKKFPNWAFLAWTRTTWGGWGLNLGGSLVAAIGVLVMRGGLSASSVMSAVIAAVVTGFASAGALEFKKDLIGGAKTAGDSAAAGVTSTSGAVSVFKKGPPFD